MTSQNFADSSVGSFVVDVSSEVADDNCKSSNLLIEDTSKLWLTREAPPQHITIKIPSPHPPIGYFGWHCWHNFTTNPKKVQVYSTAEYSRDDTAWTSCLSAEAFPGSGTQMYQLHAKIPSDHAYIRIHLLENFGGSLVYMNRLYLFEDYEYNTLDSAADSQTPSLTLPNSELMGTETTSKASHISTEEQLEGRLQRPPQPITYAQNTMQHSQQHQVVPTVSNIPIPPPTTSTVPPLLPSQHTYTSNDAFNSNTASETNSLTRQHTSRSCSSSSSTNCSTMEGTYNSDTESQFMNTPRTKSFGPPQPQEQPQQHLNASAIHSNNNRQTSNINPPNSSRSRANSTTSGQDSQSLRGGYTSRTSDSVISGYGGGGGTSTRSDVSDVSDRAGYLKSSIVSLRNEINNTLNGCELPPKTTPTPNDINITNNTSTHLNYSEVIRNCTSTVLSNPISIAQSNTVAGADWSPSSHTVDTVIPVHKPSGNNEALTNKLTPPLIKLPDNTPTGFEDSQSLQLISMVESRLTRAEAHVNILLEDQTMLQREIVGMKSRMERDTKNAVFVTVQTQKQVAELAALSKTVDQLRAEVSTCAKHSEVREMVQNQINIAMTNNAMISNNNSTTNSALNDSLMKQRQLEMEQQLDDRMRQKMKKMGQKIEQRVIEAINNKLNNEFKDSVKGAVDKKVDAYIRQSKGKISSQIKQELFADQTHLFVGSQRGLT